MALANVGVTDQLAFMRVRGTDQKLNFGTLLATAPATVHTTSRLNESVIVLPWLVRRIGLETVTALVTILGVVSAMERIGSCDGSWGSSSDSFCHGSTLLICEGSCDGTCEFLQWIGCCNV